ncbi:MAG TPA: ribosomal protein S18-alanine N-acetyltransferase [Candidatus Stackebrandtia excrementipullorum]|nr:ribosomal protein S18-alanine N-acetyltransferase [Candidatus Stackebrandtia excrementipullorum]
MHLERLRWWHIDRLVAIERELFGAEAWSAGMFWSELAARHHYRIAVEGDEILGYAGLAVADGESWVNNIAVRGCAQRRGVGAALLEDLMAEAMRRGCRSIALEVATDNHAAQAMYDRYGFEGVGVRRGYYQPSNKDALIMIRPLSD